MRLLFHREAVDESIEASNYYEARRHGLGREFDDELEAAFVTILENPRMWPREPIPDVHRYRMTRFPYVIIYNVEADAVTVYAIAHSSREPGYWLDRL